MLYWLVLIPLAAGALCGLARDQRKLALIITVPTAIIAANIALSLPGSAEASLAGVRWTLGPLARHLLVFIHMVTALLLVLAALSRMGQGLYAPIWTSVAFLTAVMLIDSPLISFLLLSMALALIVLAALPLLPSGLRGASLFLAWIMLPIPFVIASFALLDRFATEPAETWLLVWAAWAVAPPVVFWLTLFPLHDTTRAWAQDGSFVAPMFLWLVKDAVVIYLVFTLWQRNPSLDLPGIRYALSLVALVTALVSGASAVLLTSPAAVLAAAATSTLGLAVQGLLVGSANGASAGLALLLARAVALLLGGAALASPVRVSFSSKDGRGSFSWRKLVVMVSFSVAVLVLTGLPPSLAFAGRRELWSTVSEQAPWTLAVMWLSSLGIGIAWLRTIVQLWRSKLVFPAGSTPNVFALVTLALLVVCGWVAFYPQATEAWIVSQLSSLLPAKTL